MWKRSQSAGYHYLLMSLLTLWGLGCRLLSASWHPGGTACEMGYGECSLKPPFPYSTLLKDEVYSLLKSNTTAVYANFT